MTGQAKGRIRRHLLLAGAGAALLLGAAACAAKVDSGTERRDAVAQPELRSENARHFHGPVSVLIDVVRTSGNLRADQAKELATIAHELQQDRAGRRALRQKLESSAVAVVRAGSADSPEFDQSVSLAQAAIEQRVQRNVDALEEIHAMLAPDQRTAVAQVLRQRIEQKFGKRRHRGVRRVADELMLTTLQLDKLEAMKREWFDKDQRLHPTREELLALVDAFQGEEFSTALEAFRAKKSKVLRDQLARAGKRTNAVLSLLTPEQRTLLADLIEQGPYPVLFGEKARPTAGN